MSLKKGAKMALKGAKNDPKNDPKRGPKLGKVVASKAREAGMGFSPGTAPREGFHSQQDPAGLTVDPPHGIVVGDGFFPEIHDLHGEKFLKKGKKNQEVSLPAKKIHIISHQRTSPQKSPFLAVFLPPNV